MKKIIVINLGWEQEPLLDLIDKQGFEIYGIHYNQNYYKKPRYKDMLITDLRDLAKILNYAEKIKPDAVISDQCDYSYFAQAVIAEKFNLQGPRIKEAQIATNKYLQRIEAKKHNILSPEFKLCTSIDDIFSFIDAVSLPIILKPVDNRGSFGVNKVDNINEIKEAFYDALINSHSRYILAEKFIKGVHITVDGYVFKNYGTKALSVATKKKLEEKKHIIDGEIVYPGNLSDTLYKKAEYQLEYIAKLFGFSFGFLHGEFILDKNDNIYLTEIANRGGGVFTSEIIVPNFCGFDLIGNYLNNVMGIFLQDISKIRFMKQPTLMKFFSFPNLKHGIIKNINGFELIEEKQNVLKIKLFIKKGEEIHDIRSGADRHGVIILTSSNKEQLLENINEVLNELSIEIEKN